MHLYDTFVDTTLAAVGSLDCWRWVLISFLCPNPPHANSMFASLIFYLQKIHQQYEILFCILAGTELRITLPRSKHFFWYTTFYKRVKYHRTFICRNSQWSQSSDLRRQLKVHRREVWPIVLVCIVYNHLQEVPNKLWPRLTRCHIGL